MANLTARAFLRWHGAFWTFSTPGFMSFHVKSLRALLSQPADRLPPNQTLAKTGFLTSPDGRFTVVLQEDSNLVLYGPGHTAIWASNTVGRPVSKVTMQSDGNLV